MTRKETFLPDFPKGRFNLICGSSGAGKTRWILPKLIELHRSGVKVLYTCCDRSVDDAKDTMEEIGYDPEELPTVSFMDKSDAEWTPEGLYSLTDGIEHELLFIETIGALAGDINKMQDVLKFGRRIHTYMRLTGASIWGSSWCPKTREGDRFIRTRDNVMGSAAWPGICGTIVYIEALERGSAEREITIMPRSSAERVEHVRFDELGRLVPFIKPTLDGLLAAASGTLTWDDLVEWAGLAKVSLSSLKRWKDDMLGKKKLSFMSKGRYLVGTARDFVKDSL